MNTLIAFIEYSKCARGPLQQCAATDQGRYRQHGVCLAHTTDDHQSELVARSGWVGWVPNHCSRRSHWCPARPEEYNCKHEHRSDEDSSGNSPTLILSLICRSSQMRSTEEAHPCSACLPLLRNSGSIAPIIMFNCSFTSLRTESFIKSSLEALNMRPGTVREISTPCHVRDF